jgi:hypothetical protein
MLVCRLLLVSSSPSVKERRFTGEVVGRPRRRGLYAIARVDYDIPGSQQCLQTKKVLQDICMFLDWTNWTFWVTALALIAFGFNLRAMALLENTQKAGRGDPGIDTAPPNRNRALKQGECRRGFKVSLAPIEHPRFGQMRLICAKSL